jgi:peptidyl-tRNA hydrolase, PTH1 family
MNYIIVGLGNPGEEYVGTRHNTGRIAVETFAEKIDVDEWKEDKKIKSEVAKTKVGKNTVILVKPNTFMNKSGDAVKSLVKNKKQAETLVVIHDDLDLPFGKIKISFNKSAGGHKGVGSIMRAIKTEAFIRMRIGISPVTPSGKMKKPSGEKDVTDLILGKFKPAELDTLKKIMKNAAMGLESIVTEGRDVATMKINSL